MAVDVRLVRLDQCDGEVVQPLEVVRRKKQLFATIEPQPADIFLDGLDEFDVFRLGVGVVEPQVTHTGVLLCDAEIQANGLGVADVEIAVRLGRKAGHHATTVLARLHVLRDHRTDEVLLSLRHLSSAGLTCPEKIAWWKSHAGPILPRNNYVVVLINISL